MGLVKVNTLAIWSILAMILCGLSCGESGNKAWEKEAPILLKKELELPVAGNYRPVLGEGAFFLLELRQVYGEAHLYANDSLFTLEPCAGLGEGYQLDGLMDAFIQAKKNEGGNADIVFAVEPDVSIGLVMTLVRYFRLRGIDQFYFQVKPSDGANVDLALLQYTFPLYTESQLHQLEADLKCDSSTGWDSTRLGEDQFFQDLGNIPPEKRIWIQKEGKYPFQSDEFSLSGLGNQLRRQQELSESPERYVFGLADELRYENFIVVLDQMILSGIADYTLLSKWEFEQLPQLE